MTEDTTEDTTGKRSLRDRLVDMALDRFTLGRTEDERAYLVENGGPNIALLPGLAKKRLAAVALADLGTTPGRTPLDEAWTAIEGIAATVDKTALPLRVADHDGAAVLDLGDTSGRAVVVTADGWELVERSPVTFRRSRAALPLPEPTRGGDLAPLWAVVNVPEGHRAIVRAWLACALLRNMPHPVLSIRGEQGAAKTTATTYLGALLDPCAVPTLRPPTSAEGWATTALARWVIAVDNVSKIDNWWSDELCRTVTGAGSLTRALYTDDDAVAKPLRGAVILNGIALSSALRSDLAERLLPLELVRPGEYRTEAQVGAHFDAHHRAMLGAVLDDAAAILAHRDRVTTPRDLRMADFALALAAFDAARGTDALDTYRAMHDEAAAEALDTDAIARAVLDYLAPGDTFDGTASDLLKRLGSVRDGLVHAGDLDPQGWWPKDGARLSGALTRSGPLLAAHGVTYRKGRNMRGRTLHLARAGEAATSAHDAMTLNDASPPNVVPKKEEELRAPGKKRDNKSTSVISDIERHGAAEPAALLRLCERHSVEYVVRCPYCRSDEAVAS